MNPLLLLPVCSIYIRMAQKHGHGIPACYQRGCRRRQCRSAWAAYIRQRNQAAGPRPTDEARDLERWVRLMATVEQDEMHGSGIPVQVALSPLGALMLAEIQRRTNAHQNEIVDRLLRECGTDLTAA